MKLTRLVWLASLLGLLPSAVDANPGFPDLGSTAIQSPQFEMQRLLCQTCGLVMDIVYLPERESFFASTYTGDVWQINLHGQLIDVLRGSGQLPDSGVFFEDDSYVDWVFSGDATPKAYRQILDGDALSETEFEELIATADYKAIRLGNRVGLYNYYIQQGDSWSLVYKSHETQPGEALFRPVKGVIYNYPQSDRNSEPLRFIRLSPQQKQSRYDWTDTANPLRLLKFKRQGRSRSGLFDFNSVGWDGLYGRGQFELRHQGEILRFSAFHRRLNDNREAAHLELYQLPDTNLPAAHIGFLSVTQGRHHQKPGETGLYVIKPKSFSEPPTESGRYQTLHQRYWWRMEFADPESRQGKLRQELFINGSDSLAEVPLAKVPPSAFMPVPLELDFYHALPEAEEKFIYYLLLNDQFYSPNASSGNFYTRLHLDEQETTAAFAQLGTQTSEDTPLTLRLSMDWMAQGLIYRLSLHNGESEVPLRKARLSARTASESWQQDFARAFDQDRLKRVFDPALESPAADELFMAETSILAISPASREENPYELANASLKMIIARLRAGDEESIASAERHFHHYLEKIYPHTGHHEKTLDLASMGLVLGVKYNKPEVIELIFKVLLDEEKIHLAEINNDVLLYNLTCYYALQQQKEKMLEMAKLAVKQGKQAEQFLADSDFTHYWQDEDFLRAIGVEN
jgi:hypothetical protein